jgi:tRNA (guanine-N7-)-methyltransferase
MRSAAPCPERPTLAAAFGMSTEEPPGEVRGAFFGRRKGKTLRQQQASVMAGLLPRLSIDLTNPAPASLRSLFSGPVDEVRLEIGFGGGEHLLSGLHDNPQTGFIGCEPFVNGMAKLLAAVQPQDFGRLRLFADDATALLRWLPPHGLDRIDILYPDPWPKRRQRKRRLISDDTVAMMARSVRSGGSVRFATDIDDYAGWALNRFLRHGDFAWDAVDARAWKTPWPHWPGTRYEAKALAVGRVPTYLTFRRV